MWKFGCFVIVSLTANLIHSADLCTEMGEIAIKGTMSVYGLSMFQKVANEYQLSRTLYGISEKYSLTMYSNHEQWMSLVNDTNVNAVDFSILDTDFNADQLLFANYLAIPVTFGKFIFICNLPNITNISLSVEVIADILLLRVTYWNDSAITNLNPDIDLPDAQIQLIAVNGSSVQNFYLSYFLSSYSQRWNTAFGDKPFHSWPANIKGYSFSPGQSIAGIVNNNPYSFSYAGWQLLYNSKSVNVKLIKIIDVKQDVIMSTWPPGVKNVFRDVPNAAYFFDTTPFEAGKLYPFIFFQNAIVKMDETTCCIVQEILGLVDFFFDFKMELNQMGGFFPMPRSAVQNIRSSVMTQIMCQNRRSFEEFKKYDTLQVIAEKKLLITISAPSSIGGLLMIVIIAFLVYYRKMQLIRENFWIINSKDIKIDTHVMDRLGEKSWSSNMRTGASEHAISVAVTSRYTFLHKREGKLAVYFSQNKLVSLVLLNKKKSPNTWRRTTKMLMANFCKNIVHINISLLYGIWQESEGKLYTVSEICEKGSLNYVLATCPYTLSTDIKYSIANDVIKGMHYLHKKGVVHGNLNSFNCEVDSLWTVKVTKWSCYSIYSSEFVVNVEKTHFDNIEDSRELIKLLFVEPEVLNTGIFTFGSDMYSYGMLLVEIFNQQTPFFEEIDLSLTDYQELIKNKKDLHYDVPMMKESSTPDNIRNLITLLVTSRLSRLDSNVALKMIQEFRGNSSNNIVDIVMKTLESHVEDLEEKIRERTVELTYMTNRMKDLLNQLLPPQIATQFINGEVVQPEFYECATIVFSDIVGFTTISARSTPIQVMSFLNELWKEFDTVAEAYDVYKVDTIGDAYMAASGLPIRNGVNHCKHAADLALAIMHLTNTFRIPHLEGEQLKIRLGINSGPVTAGVVGFKMPQYCVFGDTVNTASRMESTSLPFKIQVSERFKQMTFSYFPIYEFEYRGEIQIKGKGVMKTFWLMGKKQVEI